MPAWTGAKPNREGLAHAVKGAVRREECVRKQRLGGGGSGPLSSALGGDSEGPSRWPSEATPKALLTNSRGSTQKAVVTISQRRLGQL